jgi:predicted RNA-binding Zn-ribbon protein involved in translation (DUF1610 family)
MKRAIDSEKFYDFLTDQLVKETGAFSKGVNKGLNIARSALHNEQITPAIPAADVAEVRPGEWIPVDEKRDAFDCSECDAMVSRMMNYCPNCGARMIGGNENG